MLPNLCSDYIYPKKNEIGQIPAEAYKDKDRTELCLADIQLVQVSPKINQFKYLKVCHLTKNHLRALPEEFFELTCLQSLDASNNLFCEISKRINRLTQLNHLNFSNNKIRQLPIEIGQLTNLNSLTLSDNHLQYLPDEIGGLENLRELYLAGNQIVVLPHGIKGLRQLENLHLKANLLTTLPREISCLQQLVALTLTQNRLNNLPFELGYLKNLKKLFLKRNPFLLDLPYSLLQWRRTMKLRLDAARMRQRLYEEIPGRFPTLVELAAARVFPRLSQIQPQVLPRELFEYLRNSDNSYLCKTCERSGRSSELHFGDPSKIVRRWSKWFNNRRMVLPFSFQHCLPCYRHITLSIE